MYFAGLDLLQLKEYFDISLSDSDYLRLHTSFATLN